MLDPGEPQPREPGPVRPASRPVLVPVPSETGAHTSAHAETSAQRFTRGAHRTLLYAYVIAAVALLVFLIALAVGNSRAVTVSWVFGSSSVSLVWLVMGSAILGLFLGMLIGALLRHRTRRPRDSE